MGEGNLKILQPTLGGVGTTGSLGVDLLRTFGAISKALNVEQPLSMTLDLIAEKVSQTMGHMYCAIYLHDAETGELRIKGSYGLSKDYVERLNTDLVQRVDGDEERSGTVTVTAFRSRMPMHVADITKDPRFELAREMILKAGYNSVVSLPLIFRGEAIGVLNCYDRHREYSEEQVDALMTVAEQTASAVGIARLLLDQQRTIAKLDELYQRLAAQHSVLQRSGEVHAALTAALLDDRSLHEMTAALAELLETPVVLQDDGLEILSRAGEPEDGYAGIPPGGSDRSWPSRSFAGAGHAGRAVRVDPDAGQDHPAVLATRIVAGGESLGYLSAPVDDDDKVELSARTLEEAATVYALHMTRQRFAHDAEARVRGDLLLDLLTGHLKDEDEVRERCRYLGIDFQSRSYRILVSRPLPADAVSEDAPNLPGTERIRASVLPLIRGFSRRVGPGGGAAIGNNAAMLVPEGPSSDAREVARRLAQVCDEETGIPLRIGVSAPCSNPDDISRRYAQTNALLDLAEHLDSTDVTIFADDWEVYSLLVTSSAPEDLRTLARSTLNPLTAHDHDGQLLATLQAYVDSGLNLTRTAENLYAHVNTVRYRLQKISGLIERDLNDLDEVLKIKIALMVRALNPEVFENP